MRILLTATTLFMAAAPQDEADVSDAERSRFVFMSVMECCLEDDLPQAALDRILKRDGNEYVNFIPKCPICTPALDAFRMFAAGGARWMYESDRKTPTDILAQLQSDSPQDAQAGLKRYIQRAVEKRCRALRLTATERERLQEAVTIGMKQGLRNLETRPAMKDCPSCRGASDVFTK